MKTHVNIELDEVTVPYYTIHKDGLISGFFGDYRFLSNFYPLENGVFLSELCFPSVENAYQAAKWPERERTRFINISAGESKKLGKQAPNFNGAKWNKKKYDIMAELVRQKFANNNILKKKLLLTDGFILEEMNSWGDMFWGVNINRFGENNLGKILMNIRDNFIQLEKKDNF
jgi:ribA/ribD-fused uncharacterized protein